MRRWRSSRPRLGSWFGDAEGRRGKERGRREKKQRKVRCRNFWGAQRWENKIKSTIAQ